MLLEVIMIFWTRKLFQDIKWIIRTVGSVWRKLREEKDPVLGVIVDTQILTEKKIADMFAKVLSKYQAHFDESPSAEPDVTTWWDDSHQPKS